MISNQILQNTMEGLKSITKMDLAVLDTEGRVLSTTFREIEESAAAVTAFAASKSDSQIVTGYQFFKVYDESQLEYIIAVKGETDDAFMIGRIACFEVSNLMVAYKERFDKDNFIKMLQYFVTSIQS